MAHPKFFTSLKSMIPLLQKRWPPAVDVMIEGEAVSVAVKVSSRAQSYRLSLPHGGGPVLTVPKYGRWNEALAFLNKQTDWLAVRLESSIKPVAFVRGAIVPLRGIDHRMVPTGRVRGVVEVGEHEGERALLVPGAPEHRARRLIDWLKIEAERDLTRRSRIHADYLGVKVKSIVMRSQSTRWGSCSTAGQLNFNWRLVLAPPFVLDYVAAHEVSHLVEMNHSDKFWKVVESTLPTMERGREWLRVHGRVLMVYGLEG
ncbi:MAG: SprT family zinc-dependent metalloprotease [Devosia sp.]